MTSALYAEDVLTHSRPPFISWRHSWVINLNLKPSLYLNCLNLPLFSVGLRAFLNPSHVGWINPSLPDWSHILNWPVMLQTLGNTGLESPVDLNINPYITHKRRYKLHPESSACLEATVLTTGPPCRPLWTIWDRQCWHKRSSWNLQVSRHISCSY